MAGLVVDRPDGRAKVPPVDLERQARGEECGAATRPPDGVRPDTARRFRCPRLTLQVYFVHLVC